MKNWYQIYFVLYVGTLASAMDNPADKYKYETPFTRAIIQADLVTVEQMLQQNPALANEPNKEGVPPLFLGAANCECNRFPADEPIDPETQKKVCACVLITQRLLEAGADKNYYLACPEDRKSDYGTPLMVAFNENRLNTFGKILDFKPDLSIRKPNGTTILLMVAEEGNPTALKKLLLAGADVKHKDENGNNALYYCGATEETGDTAKNIKRVVKAGADINQVYKGGNNILMLALLRQPGASNYLVDKLLQLGINPHHRNDEKQTALLMVKANEKQFMREYIIPLLEKAEKEYRP